MGSVRMEARQDMDFDVIDPMTAAVVSSHSLDAGDSITLSGAEALILRGAYR